MKSLNRILENELKSGSILLVSISSRDYRDCLKNLVEFSVKKFKKICYVAANDPCGAIRDRVCAGDVSKLFFIDCVSSTVGKHKDENNVIFVSSPQALTEISIVAKKVIQSVGVDFVIFDSISAIMVYEKSLAILKFIHSLVLTCRDAKLAASFIILKEDVGNELLKDLAMFVDKVVEA